MSQSEECGFFKFCKNAKRLSCTQVGDGYADHSYWGRPEDMTMARPAWAITTSAPGSELAGETAAAMAAASVLFKTANPSNHILKNGPRGLN